MRKAITFLTALFGTAAVTAAGASAHTRHEVHDMLHGYGYDNVVYQSQYGGGYGKPNYRFRACQGRRAFVIDVDWYGHVISRDRDGRCYGDDYGYRDRRDW